MESEQAKKAKTLEVRTMFEPSRVAQSVMAQAYDRVVPAVYREIDVGRNGRQDGRDDEVSEAAR